MFKICLFCLKLVDSFKVFVLFAQSYRTQWARSYLRMSVLISWQFCQQQHFTELSRGFIEWRQQKLHGFLRIFLSLKIHESTISSATLLQRNSLKYDERGMEVHILRLTHLEVTLLNTLSTVFNLVISKLFEIVDIRFYSPLYAICYNVTMLTWVVMCHIGFQ